MSIIIMLGLTLALIVLTEVMLSSKNRTKNDAFKKVLFWAIVACMTLCLSTIFIGVTQLFLPLGVVINIFPLLMIPVRIVFELVLIGSNIERHITSSNNQSERQIYGSNYSSNTQNNN